MLFEYLLDPVRLIPMSFVAMVLGGIVFGVMLPAEKKTTKLAGGVTAIVFGVPALLFAGVTLSVQGVKADALATSQAESINEALQSETFFMSRYNDDWKTSPIADAALSDDLKVEFTAEDIRKLNAGETFSFTSDSGKSVELGLAPGSTEGRVNVVLKHDGVVIEDDALKGFKASDKVGESYESSWIDQYPTLVKAPSVGKTV